MLLVKVVQIILLAQMSMLEGQLQVLEDKGVEYEFESQREIKDLQPTIAKKAKELLREILSISRVVSTFYKRISSQKLSQELANTQELEQINVKTYMALTEWMSLERLI